MVLPSMTTATPRPGLMPDETTRAASESTARAIGSAEGRVPWAGRVPAARTVAPNTQRLTRTASAAPARPRQRRRRDQPVQPHVVRDLAVVICHVHRVS